MSPMIRHLWTMAKLNSTPPDLRTQHGRLRWARERAGFESARGAARAKEWPENTYRSHEDGSRLGKGLKLDVAEKYARAFRVNLSWLLTGKGDALATNPVDEPKVDLSPDELKMLEAWREAKRRA